MLATFRALSGVSAATWVTGIILYMNLFPPERSVKVAGLASFLAAGGQLIAGASGGALAQSLGVQAPFLGSVALAALGMLILLPVTEKRTAPGRQYNLILIKHTLRSPVMWTTSIPAAVVQFAGYATTYGFTPIYAAQMGSTSLQLGWLTSAMLSSYAVSAGLLGLFITSRLEKWVVVTGLLAISAATIGQIFSRSVSQLILTRILHGIGHGFSLSVLLGFSVKHVPFQDRALVMGFFQSIYATGIIAGPAIAGLLAQHFGIEPTFLIVSGIVLAAIPLVVWGFHQQPRREALMLN
jgi:MFS family permease